MHPTFSRRIDELSPASDRTWAIGATTGLALTLVAAYVALPPEGGRACAYVGLFIRGGLYLRARDGLASRGGEVLTRLFEMGLVAGILELGVDWWLVHGIPNGTLDYMGRPDVVLLASPAWMPLAWACVITELGYPAVRLLGLLRGRLGDRSAAIVATVVVAMSAGLMVGFYEVFAFRAGWWKYGPASAMLGPTCALFIPLGEAFMFLAILPAARLTLSREERRVTSAIDSGALFAAAILAGYVLAYALLEAGRTPGG